MEDQTEPIVVKKKDKDLYFSGAVGVVIMIIAVWAMVSYLLNI